MMINIKKHRWILILAFFLVIIFIHLPVLYTALYHEITGAPEATMGSMDLSKAKLSEEKVYLDGQWEFYWNHLIESEPIGVSTSDMIVSVPDPWSNYQFEGEQLPAKGYGSYRLIIEGLEYKNKITISVPNLGGAYKVFVDGQLASESGTLSKEIDKIHTTPKAKLYPVVLSQQNTHEIVIEVATTRFSGLYMTPVLRDYDLALKHNGFKNAVEYTLFGIIIFSFISLLSMYIVNIKQKLHSLWLPVMVFFIMMKFMLTAEFYSIWQSMLFFNISYEATNELMYFTTFVLKYLLLFFVEEQCGIKFTKREKIGFLIYYILLYFVYLFVPDSTYSEYFSVLIPMLTYVLDIYVTIKIYQDWNSMKKFGTLIFLSTILVIVGLTLDSYYINGKIYMDMSLTMVLFLTILALIMNWIYAMRTRDLYDDFSKSSFHLELANSQIAMQKEYYKVLREQIDEIREIKHDIHHFTGVMRGLVEEGKLDELRIFLGEYGKKTETEQLPFFCENIVANSIIGYYYLQAKEYGIPFESRCNIGSKIDMSDSDLCIVLGNALENAIDACKRIDSLKDSFVFIEVGTVKKQRLIRVRNAYNGQIETKDGRYITSKESKSHGLGIRNIIKVVESYGGFVKIEHNENEFVFMAVVHDK